MYNKINVIQEEGIYRPPCYRNGEIISLSEVKMKMIYHYLISALVLIQVCLPRQVYAIDIIDNPNINGFINLSGEIKPKDAEKLAVYYKTNNIAKSIFIDSPGGDLIEAIRIAEIVQLLQLQVVVPKGKYCTSACFLVFLAGNGRTAVGTIDGKLDNRMPVGYVGLHRPYLGSVENNNKSQLAQSTAMKKVIKYLDNQLVPRRLIDMMMSRPSNDIYWLTSDDIEEIGDYAPAQEELYISKCGYDRKIFNQMVEAKNAGNYSLHSEIKQRLNNIIQCIATLQIEPFDDGLKKLKSGWLPSKNPLKDM